MTGIKVTAETIRAMKARGEKIAALTAYDCPMTRLLDEAGVPLILVGDSLGMVVLGYPDTTHVTMAEMEHHVRAAARAKPRALLAADLPYHSYETVADAVANAKRLVAAGAEAVKAEGGAEILEQVRAIVGSGIPFLGHLGMLPQHVLEEGGYHVKGKSEPEHQRLLADAHALAAGGRLRRRARTGHAAGGEGTDAAASHPDHRDWRGAGLRRANPGHARLAGHVALVQPQTREAQAQRRRADAGGGQGMEAERGGG